MLRSATNLLPLGSRLERDPLPVWPYRAAFEA